MASQGAAAGLRQRPVGRQTAAWSSEALAETLAPFGPIGAAQQQALMAYGALLARWNDTYNLTALQSEADSLARHLADCVAAWAVARRRLGCAAGLPLGTTADRAAAMAAAAPPWAAAAGDTGTGESARPAPEWIAGAARAADVDSRPLRWLDVGSGGGLPGVVWAILSPNWAIDCIDTVGKKAAFIRQVAVELGLRNLQAVHARVEAHTQAAGRGAYDVITCRAFAQATDLVAWSRAGLRDEGVWLMMKARTAAEEGAAAVAAGGVRAWWAEPVPVAGLEAERALLWLAPKTVGG